jgi:transposase
MTDLQTDFDFLPLRVIGRSADGKKRYDRDGKRKLIEACQKPGASVAGLALKADATLTPRTCFVEVIQHQPENGRNRRN